MGWLLNCITSMIPVPHPSKLNGHSATHFVLASFSLALPSLFAVFECCTHHRFWLSSHCTPSTADEVRSTECLSSPPQSMILAIAYRLSLFLAMDSVYVDTVGARNNQDLEMEMMIRRECLGGSSRVSRWGFLRWSTSMSRGGWQCIR